MEAIKRHDLMNSVVVIKRLIQFSKPLLLKLIDDYSKFSAAEIPDQQIENIKQALDMLEKEAKKLAEICDTLPKG